jgi:hypothetical protein
MTASGEPITMADEDVDSLNNIIVVSATKNCSEGQRFVSALEVTSKATRAKWFLGTLPKALRTLAKMCHCLRELLLGKYCVNS